MEISVADEVRIAAPADEVWALTQDWRRRPEWDPFVRAAEVVGEDPLRLQLELDRGVRAQARAEEFDRPRRARLVLSDVQGGGPVRGGEGTWDYVEEDGATVFRQRLTLEVGGMMGRAAAPMIRSGLERANAQALARVRELVEGRKG